MSRWHCNDCPGPDINVPEDGVPVCRACEASPNLEEIVRKAQDSSVIRIKVPEDRPVGSMNLSWPASVPWTRNGVSLLHSTHTDARVDGQGAAAVNLNSVTQRITTDYHAPGAQERTSAVYTNRLSTTQLRLLRLDPVEAQNTDMPLHVTLETYELDDSPEYEAISYTWAGEGGDPTPRKPIYVGPYWDVLIQTENCSSMLRDLRPRWNHAFRRLWVDAICINQNDILERDGQVSRMGDIYSHCMRVVVYLPVESPRNLRSLGNGKANRPRIRLTQDVLLHLIHTTRYFTRVWIIQELILPPMVVFHLKDEDWYFSPLGSDIDWSQTRAPWAADMVNPRSFGKLRLVDILARTWYSEAADTRDKIFGVLGLLPINTISRHRFEPNYSLCTRDVFIGAAAYIMLVERQLVLLVTAIGNDHATLGYPSWSPDFNHQPSPFALTDICSEFSTKVPQYWTAFVARLCIEDPWELDIYYIYPRSRAPSECQEIGCRNVCSCRCGGFDHVGQDDHDSATKNSMDSATGALILDCTRIFREPVSLADTVSGLTPWCKSNVTFTKRIMRPEGLILFEWKGEESGLLIMVSNSGGDQGNYLREKYTLLVAGQSSGTPVLLCLQPEAKTSSRSSVLRHSHPIIGMSFFTRHHDNSPLRRLSEAFEEPFLCPGSLFETLGKLRRLSALPLNELVEKARKDGRRAAENDQSRLITEDLLRWFFPGQGVVLQDVLPVLSELLTIESLLGEVCLRGSHEVLRESEDWSKFIEQYETFLKRKCPDLQPRLLEGTRADPRYFISFLYPNDSWSEITEQVESSDTVLNEDYFDIGAGLRQRFINHWHTQDTRQEAVVVTFNLPFWCFYLLRLEILRDVKILREFKMEVNEIECEGKPEHRDVYIHEPPKKARQELGFVWEHETITIV